MKGKIKSSLANFPLTAHQRTWIDCVYPRKGKISERDAVRALIGKIPADFKIYKEMCHFWDGHRLTIFGLYKANPKDEILETLHLMLQTLRLKYVRESGRDFVTQSEFCEAFPNRIAAIKRIFNSTYLNEFWIDPSLQEQVGVDLGTGEPRYEFGGTAGMQHVMGYKDLESQIEIRWRREIGVPGGTRSILASEAALSTGLVQISDDSVFLLGGGSSPRRGSIREQARKKTKPEIITVSPDGLVATWKGKPYPVNASQGDILRACVSMWIENGRKPLFGRIEQVHRITGDDNLPTVGRAFNNHALAGLFKILKGKGTFEFRP
jgi:hypothetical protein